MAVLSPETLPSSGALIEWHNVNFSVPDRSTGQQKRILTNMHGLAQPGRLLAIMGPSGAGKSTLLDVLACTSSSRGAVVEGRLTVDGAPRNARSLRGISCYVQQKDVLMSSATLPRSVPLQLKRALVEETITELDLTSCANTLIGDETIGLKGISGGQKRRVSVGVELVKDPRVLFLDEPSSGLDSEMALSVVATLVRLARRGRTVVCTIHQPNSDITECFDDFLLLSSGRTVYGGVWSGAVDFFAQNGFSCPAFKNPTDYFLSVVTRHPDAVETLAVAYDKAAPALLAEMAAAGAVAVARTDGEERWDEGRLQQQQQEGKEGGMGHEGGQRPRPWQQGGGTIAELAAGGDHVALDVGAGAAGVVTATGGDAERQRHAGASTSLGVDGVEVGRAGALALSSRSGRKEPSEAAAVPLWFQVYVLSIRYWRTWFRSPIMMASELVQYVFTAVFIGLMYCRFSNVLGEGDYNRMACIWFAFAILCFTPSYTAVTNWTSERLLLKRELGQRLYGVTSYYLARYSVLIPFQIAQCLLFLSVMYFFTGFHASAGGFFTFFVVLSMFQIVSEGIGAVCAVATRTPTSSVILLTFVLLVLLAFSGFLTTTVPVYFRWVQKVSYLTYAYAALVEREFSHITLYDRASGETIPGIQAFPPSLRTGLSYSQNLGVLAAQVAGMEALKLTAFHLAHRLSFM